MSVSQRSGDPGLADALFSRIIRSRGLCQYPGCTSQGPYVTGHLIGRTYRNTRCLEDNAVAICPTHHALIDAWWDEKALVVEATIGQARYDQLKRLANQTPTTTSKLFWASEAERLKARCVELGLDVRRKIPA